MATPDAAHAFLEAGALSAPDYAGLYADDAILRTARPTDALLLATAPVTSNANVDAALYIADNRAGVRRRAHDPADLDVAGTCGVSGNLIAYADPASLSTARGGCVALSHSNVVAGTGADARVYVDARGTTTTERALAREYARALETDAPFVLPVAGAGIRAADGALYVDFAPGASADLAGPGLDCAVPGDVYRIGESVYAVRAGSGFLRPENDDDDATTTSNFQLRCEDVSGEGTVVDGRLRALVQAGDPVPFQRFAPERRDAHEFEFPAGSVQLKAVQRAPRAASTQVSKEDQSDALLSLTSEDRDAWRVPRPGTLVLVGDAAGVFVVERTAFATVSPTVAHETVLRPLDGRAGGFLDAAFTRFSDAIAAGDDAAMPALFPAERGVPSAAELALSEVTLELNNSGVLEIAQDVFSEPLWKVLNPASVHGAGDAGNYVRAVRFQNVASLDSHRAFAVKASYRDDSAGLAYLVLHDDAASALATALGGGALSASPRDLVCETTGAPFHAKKVHAIDGTYAVYRSSPFPPAVTKTVLRRARRETRKPRSRGATELVLSDGRATRQWIVCDVDDANVDRFVVRRKDGAPLDPGTDVVDVERFVYIAAVFVDMPSTVSASAQPGGVVIEDALRVGHGARVARDAALAVHGSCAVVDAPLRMYSAEVAAPWTVQNARVADSEAPSPEGALVFTHPPPGSGSGSNSNAAAMTLTRGAARFAGDVNAPSGAVRARTFEYTSDARVKCDVRELDEDARARCLAGVARLPLKTFRYLDDEASRAHTGALAQDVARIFPNAVRRIRDVRPLRSALVLRFGAASAGAVVPRTDLSRAGLGVGDVSAGAQFEAWCSRARTHAEVRVVRTSPLPDKSALAVFAHYVQNDAPCRDVALEIRSRVVPDMHVVDHGEMTYTTLAALQSVLRAQGPS